MKSICELIELYIEKSKQVPGKFHLISKDKSLRNVLLTFIKVGIHIITIK